MPIRPMTNRCAGSTAQLDRAINGLNNILQMTAPQKFSGKQGYSSLDRTPDRIIALYEFARSHPDWVDAFLDGLPMDEPQRRPENVLRAMENILYEDEYSEDESSVEGYGEEEDDLPVGDSLLADLEVLEAAFGLTGAADTIRPDLGGMGVSKKYLPNGKPRFERDALHRHSCYEKYMLLNKKQKRTEERKLAGAQFLGRYRLSNTALSLLPTQTQRRRRKRDKSRGLSSEVVRCQRCAAWASVSF